MKFFHYHHTNCFFIENKYNDSLLAFDAGWPCSFYEYQKSMKTINLKYSNIEWAIVSHFHMDHAGLIGEFINSGIKCYVFENQKSRIEEMERIIKKNIEYKNYVHINTEKLIYSTIENFNTELRIFGIDGIVIKTDGHSADSVSFVTSNKEVLVGDLSPENLIMDNDAKSIESWKRIKEMNGRKIFPSHAPSFEI